MVLDHVARTVYEVSCRQCGGAFGSEWKAMLGKSITPFSCNYATWLETMKELKADGIQYCPELIGVLR
jgi:hypothetical protein